MQSTHPLDPLFHPGAVAVIGASETPGKAAERRTRSLLEGGFRGRTFLINPKRDTLFGRKAYPSVEEVDGRLDLAMIVIPGRLIPEAVADAAAKGAKGVIIITAGLGETGPEGKEIEARIMDIADRHGVQVIGPNCSGMYSASGRMNFLGIPNLMEGPLSILAQSGNIIDSLTHYARRRQRGFSKIISSGNAIGVRFHDYISYLAEDPHTKVILLYLESIKDGDELVKIGREASRKKPIIALKVGRTRAGARASASHTGALAADDRIVEAAFDQAGFIRVSNVDEMFDLAEAFLDCPVPRGKRVAILPEGGGDNAVAADNAERCGLDVPLLAEERQERIRPHILQGMPTHNPIDYGGTAEENPLVIAECVEEVMADERIDMVYITGFFGGFRDIIASKVAPLEEEASQRLVRIVRDAGKPMMVHTSFAEEPYPSINILREGGIPVTTSSGRVAECLAALARRADAARRPLRGEPAEIDAKARRKARSIVATAGRENRCNLIETEALALLDLYGFPLPLAVLAGTPEQAASQAERMAFPVALKIVSPDILHKSDIGGVELNLTDPLQVKAAAQRVLDRSALHVSPDRIRGVLLAPMAAPGQECIFGLVRDPQFGPVAMFGLGGIFVEVLEDVSFGVVPLSDHDIERMITQIRGYRVLQGVRGAKPRDLGAVQDILRRLSVLAVQNPEIAALDLNPVIVHEQGATIVDARVILVPAK
jgi:acyl-CoA synthetase (NDP forming)